MNSPAFQFYADDFLAGVADMSQSEVGAYILLLCQQWNRGSIPDDAARQKALAKGEVSTHVLSKFQLRKGKLRNRRMEIERRKQAEYRKKQREKGIKSGQSRREPRFNSGSSSVGTGRQPEGNSPSPSPSPSTHTEERACELSELKKRIGDIYKRPADAQWNYAEESTLAAIVRRPEAEAEFEHILTYRRSMPIEDRKRFFPQSVASLLSKWSETLDKARVQCPIKAPAKNGAHKPIPGPTLDELEASLQWQREQPRINQEQIDSLTKRIEGMRK
jgi:uncharacterized protein YdaU (DUF1376 family)